MNEWRPFDTHSFLKASRGWDKRIKELQDELEATTDIPAYKNDAGVKGDSVSDPTARITLRRLNIQAEIEEILLNKEMLKYGLSMLTEDERRFIDSFYNPRQSIGSFVYEYGKKQGINKDYVYAERRRVLDKIGEIILKAYYEK